MHNSLDVNEYLVKANGGAGIVLSAAARAAYGSSTGAVGLTLNPI